MHAAPLDFDTAQARLADAGATPSQHESCALDQASGRILAQPVTARLDLPAGDNSAMDGYAVRHGEAQAGARLPVQQRCYAGTMPEPLREGAAIRLFTGSLMPEGADAVVMQEDGDEADGVFLVRRAPKAGDHIRRRGEDVRAGSPLLAAGTRLGAAEIALLASQGLDRVDVFPRLRVGILTTGDELVSPGHPAGPAQLYNSNGPMLAALAAGMGAEVAHVRHAPDELGELRRAFETLLADCDLVITVGGVSVGEKDLVKPALESVGGQLDLWRVRMKPGKPVALARAAGRPIVCLPGNPVSAFAVFALLVSPLLRGLQGRAQRLPPVRRGLLQTARPEGDRDDFVRVRAESTGLGPVHLQPYPQQGSNILSSLAWADALARVPAGQALQPGAEVSWYSLAEWLR